MLPLEFIASKSSTIEDDPVKDGKGGFNIVRTTTFNLTLDELNRLQKTQQDGKDYLDNFDPVKQKQAYVDNLAKLENVKK